MQKGDWVREKCTGRVGYIEKVSNAVGDVFVGWYRDSKNKIIYPRKSVGYYFPGDLELVPLELDENELKRVFTELALATKDFNWLRELYKGEAV